MPNSEISVEISGIEAYIDTKLAESDPDVSEEEIIDLIEEYATGLTEGDVVALIDEHTTYDGPSEEEIIALIEEYVGDSSEGVEETLTDIERTRRAVELPGRKVGPTSPATEFHTPSRWGIHFKIKGDTGDVGGGREGVAHIRDAVVNAGETGTFTAALGAYDGADAFDVVDSTTVDVEEGQQTVTLDLVVPESGEYLLTRDGNFPLGRGEFRGWDDHMNSGMRFIGGAKPGDYDPNTYWYYFHDLEIASSVDYHLE